jgi:hypothetical protein
MRPIAVYWQAPADLVVESLASQEMEKVKELLDVIGKAARAPIVVETELAALRDLVTNTVEAEQAKRYPVSQSEHQRARDIVQRMNESELEAFRDFFATEVLRRMASRASSLEDQVRAYCASNANFHNGG